jgi:CRISPR-associated protein Cmr6
MCYQSKNLNYIYNKEYFEKIMAPNLSADDVKTAGADIYNFVFPKEGYVAHQEVKKYANESFSLYTIYPGLMIGSGYPHASGVSNSIVGGFSFDYVTGLPIIPGSTVKGMLRSYFPDVDSDKNQEREKMICEILGEKVDIDAFEEALFEKDNVFLGAYPVIKEKEKVFASEYITPHKNPLKNPLKNPVPLSMLKVKAGVIYEFLFKLSEYTDSKTNETISEEKIANFFKELLLLGGIGAKTNVGFGQFRGEE